jgi:hypothetical protein
MSTNKGHGASCKWLASGLLGSVVPSCGGVVGSYVAVMMVDGDE